MKRLIAVVVLVPAVTFSCLGLRPADATGTNVCSLITKKEVVRVMLVPATMALLGERNWYLPKWMDRLLPHIRFSH